MDAIRAASSVSAHKETVELTENRNVPSLVDHARIAAFMRICLGAKCIMPGRVAVGIRSQNFALRWG